MHHFSCKRFVILLLLVPAVIFAQQRAERTLATTDNVRSTAGSEFHQEFGASFLDRYWRLHSDDAIVAGYYKVADLLIVPDDKARADLLHFLQTALTRLQKIPEAWLDIATQTDRAVVENQLQSEIWSLTEYRRWEWDRPPTMWPTPSPCCSIPNTPRSSSACEGFSPVYGERMMLEAGFGNDTAEQLLMHEAFQSEEEARKKWRRVTLTTVQLTSYFAGYSAIYEFRERLKREQGARFDLKRFNEQFLSYGSAPVRIIEQMMDKNQQ
jgi:hypothetical protein